MDAKPRNVYKNEGETPLECLRAYQESYPELADLRGTYAGRLDPMAEGVLLLLFGDDAKHKDAYLELDKEYEVEVLLGVSTDTGDILGIVEECAPVAYMEESLLRERIHNLVGTFQEPYPKFSSKPYQGRPLFAWARESSESFELPMHEVTIVQAKLLSIRTATLNSLSDEALMRIDKVKGDFRQDAIKARWVSSCDEMGDMPLLIVSLRVRSKSGAYMRVLAEKLSRSLGYPGLAWRIVRTKLGAYSAGESER